MDMRPHFPITAIALVCLFVWPTTHTRADGAVYGTGRVPTNYSTDLAKCTADNNYFQRYIDLAATGVFAIFGHAMPANVQIYMLKNAKFDQHSGAEKALHEYMDYWYELDHEPFDEHFLQQKTDVENAVKVSMLRVKNSCHGRDHIEDGGPESGDMSRIIVSAQKTLDGVNQVRVRDGMTPEPEAVINDDCPPPAAQKTRSLDMNKWDDVIELRTRDGATSEKHCAENGTYCDTITTSPPDAFGTVLQAIESVGFIAGQWECSIDKTTAMIRTCAPFWRDGKWRVDKINLSSGHYVTKLYATSDAMSAALGWH